MNKLSQAFQEGVLTMDKLEQAFEAGFKKEARLAEAESDTPGAVSAMIHKTPASASDVATGGAIGGLGGAGLGTLAGKILGGKSLPVTAGLAGLGGALGGGLGAATGKSIGDKHNISVASSGDITDLQRGRLKQLTHRGAIPVEIAGGKLKDDLSPEERQKAINDFKSNVEDNLGIS